MASNHTIGFILHSNTPIESSHRSLCQNMTDANLDYANLGNTSDVYFKFND